jgi:hypothetical protein
MFPASHEKEGCVVLLRITIKGETRKFQPALLMVQGVRFDGHIRKKRIGKSLSTPLFIGTTSCREQQWNCPYMKIG